VDYQENRTSILLELDSWTNLIHTEDWRAFLKLLKTHQDYLQSRVNDYLEKHEDRKAGEELAKMNDCNRLVSLVQNRITELRKQIGGDDGNKY